MQIKNKMNYSRHRTVEISLPGWFPQVTTGLGSYGVTMNVKLFFFGGGGGLITCLYPLFVMNHISQSIVVLIVCACFYLC